MTKKRKTFTTLSPPETESHQSKKKVGLSPAENEGPSDALDHSEERASRLASILSPNAPGFTPELSQAPSSPPIIPGFPNPARGPSSVATASTLKNDFGTPNPRSYAVGETDAADFASEAETITQDDFEGPLISFTDRRLRVGTVGTFHTKVLYRVNLTVCRLRETVNKIDKKWWFSTSDKANAFLKQYIKDLASEHGFADDKLDYLNFVEEGEEKLLTAEGIIYTHWVKATMKPNFEDISTLKVRAERFHFRTVKTAPGKFRIVQPLNDMLVQDPEGGSTLFRVMDQIPKTSDGRVRQDNSTIEGPVQMQTPENIEHQIAEGPGGEQYKTPPPYNAEHRVLTESMRKRIGQNIDRANEAVAVPGESSSALRKQRSPPPAPQKLVLRRNDTVPFHEALHKTPNRNAPSEDESFWGIDHTTAKEKEEVGSVDESDYLNVRGLGQSFT